MTTTQKREWKTARLGDYFRIRHGYAFKSLFFSKTGDLLVLTPGNFRPDGGLKFDGQQRYYKGEFPSEFVLRAGDLVIVMTDLTQNAPILGSPAFIPEGGKLLHNQRLGKVAQLAEDDMDRRFLYYLLNSAGVRAQIKGSATGATVKHTAPERIYNVKVEVPSLPTQRKIAAILSAYDDLIENNTRRIKILEEMAQMIYREWFVSFRFPGHENVKMVESVLGPIPEGWEAKKLGDVIELAYGRSLTADERRGGQIPVYGSAGIVGYHDSALAKGPGIIVGRKGNVGSIHWSEDDFFAIDTVFFVQTSLSLYYCCFNLRDQNFLNTDAAVPGLNRNQAYRNLILVPGREVLNVFDRTVAHLFGQIKTLGRKNANLRQTRDLLLPKLISGEADVEYLDIDIGEAPA